MKKNNFCTGNFGKKKRGIYKQLIFPHSTASVDKLQTGINIGGDVPDVVFQVFVTAFEHTLHFVDGVEDGGVVFVKDLADIRGAEVGQLAHQIHRHLTGLGSASRLFRTANGIFVNGIELTYLADDQVRSGQGVVLVFKHIPDHRRDILQCQRHAV